MIKSNMPFPFIAFQNNAKMLKIALMTVGLALTAECEKFIYFILETATYIDGYLGRGGGGGEGLKLSD